MSTSTEEVAGDSGGPTRGPAVERGAVGPLSEKAEKMEANDDEPDRDSGTIERALSTDSASTAAGAVNETTDSEVDSKKDRPSPTSKRRMWSIAPKLVEESRYNAIKTARAKALLAVDNVTVSFDGFRALNALTLILDDGELRCIIGPNGAGKTTLMDVITGKTRPDEGCVFMLGNDDRRDLTQLSEHEVAQLGIGRKFQRPTVFHEHSVFENLEMALAGNRGLWHAVFSRLKKSERERIDEVLELIGLVERRNHQAGLLSHGQKQWLEIGMLLAQSPKVLLVDEPVAGMTHQEIERTAELLKSLAGQHTVVVVEHDMDFVRSIATTVSVLHEGSLLAEGSMDKVQNDPKVIEVYLGE